eukprot:TRINITY_DN14327_c0_g1_i2.p1 TRINITY_DN14327_c0_g1~~TRINITY_DN14327_c0_g1_i2.p1  ORF type:complete len:286 (-),score=22.16 TRINITY_DN14327_c0_g1_i2:61-918(-)
MSGNPSKSQVKVLFQAGEEGVDLNGDGVSISLNLERIQAMISSLSPLFLTQNINQAELSKGLQADQTNDSLYESYSSQIDTAFDTLISDLNKMLNKERLKLKQELASFLKKRKGVIDSLSSAFQDNTSKNAPNKGAVQFKSLWDNFLTSQEKMNGNYSNLSKIPPLVQLLEKQIQSTLTPGNVLSLRWANGEKIFRMQKYSISSAPINIPFTADLDIRGSYFSMMRVGLIDRFLLQSPLRDHDLRAESCKSRALIYSNAMSQPYYAKLFYFRKTDNLPDLSLIHI